jgi:hypothetical protein
LLEAAVAELFQAGLAAYHREMTAVVLAVLVLTMMEQTALAAGAQAATRGTAARVAILMARGKVVMGLVAAVLVVMQFTVRHLFLAAAGLVFLGKVRVVHVLVAAAAAVVMA